MNRLAESARRSFTERWLGWLLRGYRWRDDLLGDLAEQPQRPLRRALEVARLSARYLAPALWLGIQRSRRLHRTKESRMHLATELRLSWRGLRKRPGTSLLIVVTLAIGLAANAAVFGFLDALILEPFSFPEPDRLLMVGAQEGERVQAPDGSVAAADFADLRAADSETVESWIGYDTRGGNLLGSESPERRPSPSSASLRTDSTFRPARRPGRRCGSRQRKLRTARTSGSASSAACGTA